MAKQPALRIVQKLMGRHEASQRAGVTTIMEVNSSPGLEGIEKATDKNVAGMIIELIEKNARQGRTSTRGRG
jgi:hypothetical protein